MRAERRSAPGLSELKECHLLFAGRLCCCLGMPQEARVVVGLFDASG
jgi:hypothetical protein